MSYKDKVILITGASAGIGKATALHFSKEKAKLILIGRNKPALDEVQDMCTINSGHNAMVIQADISKDEDIERIVDITEETYGSLDVLVNNAGTFVADDIFTATEASFDIHISTNLRPVFNLTRLLVPLLIASKGNIVNISGVETVKYLEGLLTESVSKAGIQHFTKYVAFELASKRVRVNSIALGYVTGTKIIERANLDPEEFAKEIGKNIPLGDFIKPEEVAEMIAFIASEKARHITDQNIVMDGGLSLH